MVEPPPVRKGLTAEQARRINSLRQPCPRIPSVSPEPSYATYHNTLLDDSDVDSFAQELMKEYDTHAYSQGEPAPGRKAAPEDKKMNSVRVITKEKRKAPPLLGGRIPQSLLHL